MTIREILNATDHRPWTLPDTPWKYYQEWNNALFLHWRVDLKELKSLVPKELEIDLFDNKPWVSLVAFTMEKIRPRFLPAFPPISDFDEINIRTYVKSVGKCGVYFLSIEGSNLLSCRIAKGLSELPYRFSTIRRTQNTYESSNRSHKDQLTINYQRGKERIGKEKLDKWLTERYALFQDTQTAINHYEIHHLEWPLYEIGTKKLEVDYPRFRYLLKGEPDRAHYSPGVRVIAWGKIRKKKATLPKPGINP